MSRSEGSAPLDFILTAVPLVLVALGTLSVLVNGFAKTIAQDSAIEAARFAALADQDGVSARVRALSGLKMLLGGSFRPAVEVMRLEVAQSCKYVATVRLEPIVLGVSIRPFAISERGVSVCEVF